MLYYKYLTRSQKKSIVRMENNNGKKNQKIKNYNVKRTHSHTCKRSRGKKNKITPKNCVYKFEHIDFVIQLDLPALTVVVLNSIVRT